MPPTAAAIRLFDDAFSGQIVRRDDFGHDDARIVWNGMIDRYPELVVRPTSADDVVAAIRFAREEEPRSRCAAAATASPVSTRDDGIVIDMSRMNGVRVDADERTAWVNGGALLGELDREAQSAGLVCPVGVVSHTGVAGLTLGGGMGRLASTGSRSTVSSPSISSRPTAAATGRDLFEGVQPGARRFRLAPASPAGHVPDARAPGREWSSSLSLPRARGGRA